MREIKFRAYDSENEVMEYNVGVNRSKPVKQGYQWFETSNTVRHSELMQYTGLKDKNGTEIYEGDILTLDGEISDGCCHIYYSNDELTFFLKDDYYDVSMAEINEHDGFERLVVVGNIYESPELLER